MGSAEELRRMFGRERGVSEIKRGRKDENSRNQIKVRFEGVTEEA